MKNNLQILKLLSAACGLQTVSQELDLSSVVIAKSFENFLEKFNNCNATNLARSADSVTKILNRLSPLHFILMLNQIDENFPGISFYYVLEARQDKSLEGAFFIQRLKELDSKNLMSEVFATERCKLIKDLLSNDILECSLANTVMEYIDNNFYITEREMTSISDILFSLPKKNEFKLPALSEEELLYLLNNSLLENQL